MYVCIYIYICICVYCAICAYVHLHMYMKCICICICTCACTCTCTCICGCKCICMCIYIHRHMCITICTCTHSLCVCIYLIRRIFRKFYQVYLDTTTQEATTIPKALPVLTLTRAAGVTTDGVPCVQSPRDRRRAARASARPDPHLGFHEPHWYQATA